MSRGPATLLEAFDAGAPDDVVLVFRGRDLTRAEVAELSRSLAVALSERHVGPGDHVAVLLQNDPQFVVALLATWRLGATAVSISPLNRAREVSHLLALSGACALIADDVIWGELGPDLDAAPPCVITTSPLDLAPAEGVLSGRERVRTDGTEDLLELCQAYAGEEPPPCVPDPAGDAVLTCTSGTTGPPKGARNTHANLVAGGRVYAEVAGVGPDDVIGGFAPLFHVTGLSGHLALSILSGAPLVLNHRFDAREVLGAVQEHRITFVVASITALTSLAQCPDLPSYDLSSLVRLYSGGQPVLASSAAVVERALGAPVHLAYGMTETTAPSHLVPFAAPARTGPNGALSVGPAAPGLIAVVLGPAGDPLPALEPGEVCVMGPTVVPGYYQDEAETARALSGGLLHTGDVGYLDADGWLYVVDRLKDQINASGYKVWPTEVEEVLVAHPSVSEAAVVGVPDAYRGESVKAFVSPVPGAELDPLEVQLWAKERLAAYKYPREVVVLPELPKSATGKILRRDLRDGARA
jgi:long-chain acyl-CoA synthetase